MTPHPKGSALTSSPAIKVIRPGDQNLTPVDPASTAAPAEVISQAARQIISEDRPYAHIARLPPGGVVPAHSHSTEEVTVVLSGAVDVDGVHCEAGSVLVIPANTEYSLEVLGDEPLTFLVVRPTVARYLDED